jgi:multidrug efflux pump subunit AcrA (membrane-fusion protein)
MLKKFIIPLIIFILAIIFFKVIVSTKDKPSEIEINEHIWRVEQNIVEQQTLSPAITLYGRVESSELLNAAAPAASQVAKVLVKEGENIKKGQLMLSLDKADFEPLLKHAQAKVNELNAMIKSEQLRHTTNLATLKNEKKLLKLSEKALARAEKVKRQNLGSISETEQAMQKVEMQRLSFIKMQFSVQEHQARQDQLEARLIQAQADLEKNRLALERSQIYAPFSGVVAKVNVAQGDRVNANEKLLSFYSTERLEIRAKLPANSLSEIQQSIRDGETLTGFAFSGSLERGSQEKGSQVPLLLERISGEAQASGVDAIFTITADKVYFRIGAIVVVRLQRTARDNMIKVPYQAMYGSERLYQIKDNRLQAVKVKTIGEYFGSIRDSQLLIASDALNSGDAILTTHLPNAFTGLKVEIVK